MSIGRFGSLLLLLASVGCEPAENVNVQELPPLERSSVEIRLGLPALEGAWPFAGWELAEGDTLGMETELPVFGAIQVVEQKRDSLGGVYTDAAGAAAPLSGEIRRNGVVALVAFPGGGAGRYLVGAVEGDTIWVESSTLGGGGEWRDDARAAFVRGAATGAPFRRIRGVIAVPVQPVGDTLSVMGDSLAPAGVDSGTAAAGVAPPSSPTGAAAGAGAADRPVAESDPEPEPQPDEEVQPESQPQPRPAPAVQRRPAPRVLGDPVERDDELP